ncbi:MAG: hypothetical protein LHW45_08155 [Candidatus Cloacimonetes bacterium]|nr:hypothetical protein [Candidatus Cloacimonadota bacterium]MDY0367581.1 hypothetical protein [Candidatus Syntrophosphaera sp.]
MNFIIENQALIMPLLGAVIVWILGLLVKKQIDKAKIIQILTIILDVIQDINNEPATKSLENHEKKQLAVTRVNSALPAKRKTTLEKVFGTIGGAIEFVYTQRKWLFAGAQKLIKAVF